MKKKNLKRRKRRLKKGVKKALLVFLLLLVAIPCFLNSGFVKSAKESVYSELEERYSQTETVAGEATEAKVVTEVKDEKASHFSTGADRTTEEIIWDRLRSEGYSEIEAAGITGNIWAECDMDYTQIEIKHKVGIGLIQWSWDRRETFEKVTGDRWTDLNVQLDFLIDEMNGKYGNHWTAYKSEFKNAKTPEDAAYFFSEGYERPSVKRMDVRKSQARNAYNRCAGRPVVK